MHVSMHRAKAVLADELAHELDSLMVGSHLSSQIRNAIAKVAGSGAAGNADSSWLQQELSDTGLLESTSADKLEGDDGRAFLLEGLGVRRHGAWADASNVGVMPARGNEEDDLAFGEDRGNDRYVR